MTPREFSRELSAWREQQKDERDQIVALAWHTAVFVPQAFTGKLQDLKEVLKRMDRPPGPPTFDDLKAQLEAISKATGIPLRKVS